jgi:hypothetical protein
MSGREFEPGAARLRLIERDGLLVAEPSESLPPLTVEQVREALRGTTNALGSFVHHICRSHAGILGLTGTCCALRHVGGACHD